MKQKKEKKEWSGMPTSGEDFTAIKNAVESTYESIRVIEEEKAQLKDIFEEVSVKTGIPKRVFNFLMKNNYFGDGRETLEKNRMLEEAYEKLEGSLYEE